MSAMSTQSEYCSHFVLSSIRTVLESLILPARILAYLPQYIQISKRRTTAGITSRFILRLCLFSTVQLANRILNSASAGAFHCVIYQRELRGIKGFSALLGNLQVLVQWLCVMTWLYFFLEFRSSEPDAEISPLLSSIDEDTPVETREPSSSNTTSSASLGMASDTLLFIVFAHAFIFLDIALLLLLAPRAVVNMPTDGLFRDVFTYVLHVLFILLGSFQVIALCFTQVHDVRVDPRAQGISVTSLALQTDVLLAMAFVQCLRPQPASKGIWAQYIFEWGLSVNYIVLAVGNSISLYLQTRSLIVVEDD